MRRFTCAALAIVVVSVLGIPQAAAAPVTGEARRTDTWLTTTSLSSGYDDQQGYAQLPAADYHNGGSPDCVVVTGRTPTGGGDIPVGVLTDQKDQDSHRVRGIELDGTPMDGNFTYWIHTAQDNPSDTHQACGHVTATTNASGYFTVAFTHSLAATPVAVTASGSGPIGGSNIPTSVVISAKSAGGFTGRALNQTGVAIASQPVTVDYWATDLASVNGTSYRQRAGTVNVATDASGNATINYPDFLAGQAPSSIQVTGSTASGANITGGVIAGVTSTQADIRLFSHDGLIIDNATVSVNYIASGPIGGSPRLNPSEVLFTQLWHNNLPDLTGQCGTAATFLDACIRYPLGEPAFQYRLTAGFDALGSVGGTDHTTWFQQSLADWEAKDVRIPVWSQTSTVGAEEMLIDVEDQPPGFCATTGSDIGASPTYGDGLNFLTDTTIHVNNGPDAPPFVPWSPGFSGCAVDWTYRHELGHAWGLGHNQQNGNGTPECSIMGGCYDGTGVKAFDVASARALYGYSGSIYRRDLKVTHLVRPARGFSLGLVEVVGQGRAVRDAEGQLLTPVTVRGERLNGRNLPRVVYLQGGVVASDLGPALVGTNVDTANLTQFTVGARLVVQVRDADARVFEAFTVQGETVDLGLFHGATDNAADDDVDGGDPRVVGLGALRAAARG